jgi:hypothetical protein
MNIKFEFFSGMFDGKLSLDFSPKLVNCSICNATPTQMSNFSNFNTKIFAPIDDSLVVNVPISQAISQCLKMFMNLAINGSPNESELMSEDGKQLEQKIKEKILKEFEFDWDNSRRGESCIGRASYLMLLEPEKLAEILNTNKEFVIRVVNILKVLELNKKVDKLQFEKYCEETYKIYCDNFDWHLMPVTLHKILKHSSAEMRTLPSTIGVIGQEFEKAWKDTRTKDSAANLLYVFKRQMIKSDEVVIKANLKVIQVINRNNKFIGEMPEEIEKMILEDGEVPAVKENEMPDEQDAFDEINSDFVF